MSTGCQIEILLSEDLSDLILKDFEIRGDIVKRQSNNLIGSIVIESANMNTQFVSKSSQSLKRTNSSAVGYAKKMARVTKKEPNSSPMKTISTPVGNSTDESCRNF